MSTKSTPIDNSKKIENYAIVEASGTQLWLEANRYYDMNRIDAEIDEKMSLDKVLLVKNGDKTEIGKPYVENAKVNIKVLSHLRGKKIIVYKMRPKKKTRRKNGHRQELTRIFVESIFLNNSNITTSEKAEKSKKSSKSKKDSPIK